MLELHPMFGNRNVGRFLQTKLKVSEPGDAYERQADAVAEMVMRMPDRETFEISNGPPQIQRQCSDCASGGSICPKCAESADVQSRPSAGAISPQIQRRCSACDEEDDKLQFKRYPGSRPEVTPSVAANIDALRGGGQPLPAPARAFFEPRFGYDFGDVRVHTNGRALEAARQVRAQAFTVGRDVVFGAGQYSPDTRTGRQLLAHELTHVVQQTPQLSRKSSVIQGMPENGGTAPAEAEQAQEFPSPTEEAAATEMSEEASATETTTPGRIVEDTAEEVSAGQMKKSEFLTELRTDVCSAAEEVLASTGQTTEGCPYLDYWFNYYGNQDSQHIERAIQKYSPEASGATTARDYIPIITARVRRGVEAWARTGELSEVPEGVPTELPGGGSTEETAAAAAPETGSVQFKGRSGGPREAGNPRAIQTQLGRGRSLDGSVRSRMESAFGTSFSQVRVHTDGGAAKLSGGLNARAFTVGEHVAFGSGEYQPGTLVGDAIIAHELAHVMQQRGAGSGAAPMAIGDTGYSALEEDADVSAVGAVATLWDKAKWAMANIGHKTMPRLRSGLRLSRCKGDKVECRSSSFHPTITVVTPGTRRSDCGAYTYKVQWGIPASESSCTGWIVQKVSKQFEAEDCAGNPVVPVAFDDPAGYPFWEAWEFTAGQNVWVGPAAGGSPHSGDSFSGSDYGPGTKGKKTVTGEVKAIVGFALPAGMTVRNAAPAWGLPYTRTEPAQFANTPPGTPHTLTSEWDCCPNGTVTKATEVTTNP